MQAEKIKINTEHIKLQELIKISGEAYTGGMAKVIIENGEVKVNGEVCTMRGKKLRPGDSAEYNGVLITVE